MSDQERLLVNNTETSPALVDNRVLILGSRLSGAFKLGEKFQEYLEERGIPNPDVEVLRDAGYIERAIIGCEDLDEDINIRRLNPKLPKGVILLDEMRQQTLSGMDMSLDTYSCGIDEYVEKQCITHNIPLAKVKQYTSPQQITQGLKELMDQSEFENHPILRAESYNIVALCRFFPEVLS